MIPRTPDEPIYCSRCRGTYVVEVRNGRGDKTRCQFPDGNGGKCNKPYWHITRDPPRAKKYECRQAIEPNDVREWV